jgi:hypothetical protein
MWNTGTNFTLHALNNTALNGSNKLAEILLTPKSLTKYSQFKLKATTKHPLVLLHLAMTRVARE